MMPVNAASELHQPNTIHAMFKTYTLCALAAVPTIAITTSCENNAQRGYDQEITALNHIAEVLEKAAKGDMSSDLDTEFQKAVAQYKAAEQLGAKSTAGERAQLEKDSKRAQDMSAARQRLTDAINNLSVAQKGKFALLLQEIGF